MWTRRAFLAISAAAACAAADTPPSAEAILDSARKEAADGRAVWVIFHASW